MSEFHVGLSVDNESGVVSVSDTILCDGTWEEAVETAMDMAQALYPDAKIEFDFCKEYDNG
jgi:hypothetical protein